MFGGTKKLFELHDAAMTAHDVDGFLSLFTDDCIYEDVPLRVSTKARSRFGVY